MLPRSIPSVIFAICAGCGVASAQDESPQGRILEMRPVGYWPVDEGAGEIIHDRSPTANHGRALHVPWADQGLIDFTGAYQWISIPAHDAYQTPSFTIGGWYYARGSCVGSGWPNRQGMLLFGNRDWLSRFGIQLCVRKQDLVDVVSDGTEDVMGTRLWNGDKRIGMGEPNLTPGGWHHVVYAFDAAEGRGNGIDDLPDSINFCAEGTVSSSAGETLPPESALTGKLRPVAWPRSKADGKEGRWVQISLDGERTINMVRLKVAKGGAGPALTNVKMDFSDGSSIDIGSLDDEWKGLFVAKRIGWVRITAVPGPGGTPERIGIALTKERYWALAEEGVLMDRVPDRVYTGTGTLFVDGRRIRSCERIGYRPALADLQIGPDAYWWHQLAFKSGSLDGSVRNMVWFDRALSATEAAALFRDSRPDAIPAPRPVTASSVPEQSPGGDSSRIANRDEEVAARAVMGTARDAAGHEALPILCARLRAEIDAHGRRLPRVEDFLRNALIDALIRIGGDDRVARDVLADALARPILEAADLSRDEFATVRRQCADGRWTEAFEAFRKLPLPHLGESFFTVREPGNRDYTSTVRWQGVTFQVGTGKAWEGGEPVDPAAFARIVDGMAVQNPGVRDWRKPDYRHLYRIPITRIGADGVRSTAYLEGDGFVLDGEDAKMRGWSLMIDTKGYIHLFGGQHNVPNPELYIPGSWERMGLSRDRSSPDFPRQMYWVSERPGDITSFRFAGRRRDRTSIPADYLNYMSIVQGRQGQIILYGRYGALGWQSWGLFSYDVENRRWSVVGGDPFRVIEDAGTSEPGWSTRLHDQVCGRTPTAPTEARPLAWAWQPVFYNFCRDDWGVRFDKTGRMHVRLNLSALDGRGHVIHDGVYGWSDDGRTFHRADGTPVALPLTLNPAPSHLADWSASASADRWRIWIRVLGHAGYRIDGADPPAVWR